MSQHWYLIMTKPKQDEAAESNLKRQGFEVYRPQCCQVKTRRGKKITQLESLFPRYLFIKLDDQLQNWAPIRSTKGVLQLVKFGAQAAKVDENLINQLKQQEQVALHEASDRPYKKGDKLRVESGAFYGLDAIFESYDSDQRIIVLMNILGQQQKLALAAEQLEKSSD
jgi:transcriptional antiterminator RfaH